MAVVYADLEILKAQLESILGAGISKNISVNTAKKSLTLYGNDETRRVVTQIVDDLDVPPNQVLLSTKMVELTRGFAREIGVNLTRQAGASKGNFLSTVSGPQKAKFDYKFGIIDAVGLDATLNLGESNGDAKVISNPQMVTTDGFAANFDSGITLNFRANTVVDGAVTSALTSINAGIKINVTPNILRDGRIKLLIDIGSSTPDAGSSADSIPGIISTTVKTDMIIPSGKTAAIAGLYKYTDSDKEIGVPFLQSVPIFGFLFKHKSLDKKRQEIMAFITPSVMDSVNDKSISLKTEKDDDIDSRRAR